MQKATTRRVFGVVGLVLILALGASLNAAAWDWLSGSGVKGSGNRTTESRNLPAFSEVHVKGSVDLELQVGGSEKVEVEGDDNLVALIRTEVKDGILIVDAKEEFTSRKGLLVRAVIPSLKRIELTGSGDAQVQGVDAKEFQAELTGSGDLHFRGTASEFRLGITGSGDCELRGLKSQNLEVRISGSGDVRLDGTAEKLQILISGSGDVNAADLNAKVAVVHVMGSGDVVVRASDDLDAEVMGSGDISYIGTPAKIKTSTHGSGEINRR